MKSIFTMIVALGCIGLPPFSGACTKTLSYYPVPCSCGGAVYSYVASGPGGGPYYNGYVSCGDQGPDCHAPAYGYCATAKNHHFKFRKHRIELARLESCGKSNAFLALERLRLIL